jgi:hypothetical protein
MSKECKETDLQNLKKKITSHMDQRTVEDLWWYRWTNEAWMGELSDSHIMMAIF